MNVVRKILWFAGKTLEHISWRVRCFFLESPVFLPGESGVSSWRVRCFFLESPVFLPGESGIHSWRVRCFFLESLGQSRSTRGRVAALGLDSSFECAELPRKDHSWNFALTEFYEVRMTPTRLGARSLRATPYPTIQLLENRLSVLGALLVIANLPKVFG
jgi:hypothetical protein